MKKCEVVVLAGGFGTRMSGQFPDIPKPLIPINNMPVLEHLINECKKYHKKEILVVLHYMPEKIKNYFGDGSKFGVNINYYVEEVPLGTAGALLAVKHLLDETFLVLYADVFSNLNINNFFKFHLSRETDISIVVHPNDHPYDSDIVIVDSNNKVLKFSAHPHTDIYYKNLVNAAMYIINKSSLTPYESIEKAKSDIAQDMFPYLLQNGIDISAYKTCEYIKDMGTPERLINVENDINNGVANARRISSLKKAIFLDRDGTINIENGHINNPNDFELINKSGEAINLINKSNFLAICITNQPVIARGECTFGELEEIHKKMEYELGLQGAYLDEIYFCPHHTDRGFSGERIDLKINCDCRKPKPGMLIEAKDNFNLNLKECWFIGDSEADIGAAQNAGCRSILISNRNKNIEDMSYKPTMIKNNIFEAVNYILNLD